MRQPRKNRLTDLGELQLQVLDTVVELGDATVQTVVDHFPERRRPRYTTVLTVLRTLEQKGLLAHTTSARTYHYTPTESAAQIRRNLLSEVVNKVFHGSPRDLVATLLDTEDLSPEVLDQLKKLIAESEG